MDKNIPAAGGELPPVQMAFAPQPNSGGASDGSPAAMRPQATAEGVEPASVAFKLEEADAPAANQKLRAAGDAILNMLGGSTAQMRPQAAGVATKAAVVEVFQKEGEKRKEQKLAERAKEMATEAVSRQSGRGQVRLPGHRV